MSWPSLPLRTQFIMHVIQYAMENEIDTMNEDDIEDCVEGMTDQLIDYWYGSIEPYQKVINKIQKVINQVLLVMESLE